MKKNLMALCVVLTASLFFALGFAQITFEKQLEQPHTFYTFNEDSSLLAAINDAEINIFEPSTQTWKMSFVPELPLCDNGMFSGNYLFVRCWHTVYKWDLSKQTLAGKLSLAELSWYKYFYDYDDIDVRVRIVGVDKTHNLVATNHLSNLDGGRQFHLWDIGQGKAIITKNFFQGIMEYSFVKGTFFSLEKNKASYRRFPEEEKTIGILPSYNGYLVKGIHTNNEGTRALFTTLTTNYDSPSNAFILYDVPSGELRQWFTEQQSSGNDYTLSNDGTLILVEQDGNHLVAYLTNDILAQEAGTSIEMPEPHWVYNSPETIFSISNTLTASGQALITTSKGIDVIDFARVDNLTRVQVDALSNLDRPRSYRLSPDGRFLLVLNNGYDTYDNEFKKTTFIDFTSNKSLQKNHVSLEPLANTYWTGYAKQIDSPLGRSISLFMSADSWQIGKAIAFVYYYEYPCTSRLVLQERQNETLILEEQLISGQGLCVNDGKVVLEPTENKKYKWTFYLPNGEFNSEAELELKTENARRMRDE